MTTPQGLELSRGPRVSTWLDIAGDMTFNGAMSSRLPKGSPGQYAGEDNGWVLSLVYPVLVEFDQSIIKYPNIKRFPGGASNDLMPNLQNPENPVPLLNVSKPPQVKSGGG